MPRPSTDCKILIWNPAKRCKSGRIKKDYQYSMVKALLPNDFIALTEEKQPILYPSDYFRFFINITVSGFIGLHFRLHSLTDVLKPPSYAGFTIGLLQVRCHHYHTNLYTYKRHSYQYSMAYHIGAKFKSCKKVVKPISHPLECPFYRVFRGNGRCCRGRRIIF